MSRTRRITITLPVDLIEAMRQAVERGEVRSVSEYVVRRLAPGAAMDALFFEWDSERGAPSSDDLDWADRELRRTMGQSEAPRT